MKELKKLKKEYHDTDIPPELEQVVHDAIRNTKKANKKSFGATQWMIGIAAAIFLFFSSINISPSFAQSMANIPVINSIVEVFTVQKMTVQEDTYHADLNTPAISGLDDPDLEHSLNEKYIEENKALFDKFQQDMQDMKENNGGHLGVNKIFEVKTDTEQLLSIARYEIHTNASSSTTLQYDTIDKRENTLITLPSLFKDEQYIEVISTYIIEEMRQQMDSDQNISYFLDEQFTGDFKTIKADQNFYINNNNKLIISFDKYEVAPGYMGVVTFEIPSEILQDLLVSDVYIR